MPMIARLRDALKRSPLCALLLLGAAACWGLFRTAHVLYIHSRPGHPTPTHDLYTYYSIWYVLGHRECADIALRGSLYLPHTWFVLTPLFLLGWPAARTLMWVINVSAVIYICWRLSELTSLQGVRRWLLLAFFLGWSATSNVIGLGNLALVCLAAVVAAYPFSSSKSGFFLMLAAMKQSLVFPLYFHLLLKRPKTLIVPFATFALCGLAVLWWARLGVTETLQLLKYWGDSVSTWTAVDHTCLRRLLVPFIHNKLAVTVIMWGVWCSLFGVCARWIKDPLSQLAALLLLALLPMYHNAYDMILAVPAMAVFMKRGPLVWPTLMTVALAWDPFRQLGKLLPAGPLRETALALQLPYLPVLILVFLGGLLYLEVRSPNQVNAAPPLA
jgi:hypothetical protein